MPSPTPKSSTRTAGQIPPPSTNETSVSSPSLAGVACASGGGVRTVWFPVISTIHFAPRSISVADCCQSCACPCARGSRQRHDRHSPRPLKGRTRTTTLILPASGAMLGVLSMLRHINVFVRPPPPRLSAASRESARVGIVVAVLLIPLPRTRQNVAGNRVETLLVCLRCQR